MARVWGRVAGTTRDASSSRWAARARDDSQDPPIRLPDGSLAASFLALGMLAVPVFVSMPLELLPLHVFGFSALAAVAQDHPSRARILDYLRTVPGDHFRSIARGVQLSLGETRHHLNMLLRRGHIRENKDEGRSRYYVKDCPERNERATQYWAARNLRVRVLNEVHAGRAIRPSEVAASLGISRQLAWYHLRRLEQSGRLPPGGSRSRI
ncbi:MAG TPA: winged helix-turn-helix transcriptional regulator [Thermoplasmata archaeon]|nr:winged helix-turn-helix transcriptional regulator [Thermoplasmata archaeon]